MADIDHFKSLISLLQENDQVVEQLATTINNPRALEIQKQELHALWERIKMKYFDLVKVADSLEKREAIMKEYKEAFPIYLRGVSVLDEHTPSPSIGFAPQGASSPRKAISSPPTPCLQVPAIEIECFVGDYTKWPAFRDLFSAIYINNSRLSEIEKLFHLISKTNGEAREIVQLAPLTNEGFVVAWKALTARFENKRILITNHIRRLYNIPPMTTDSCTAIRTLQREMNSCITALKHLGVEQPDPYLVVFGIGRLVSASVAVWEESLPDKTKMPSWEDFDNFLSSRFLTLEAIGEAHKGGRSPMGATIYERPAVNPFRATRLNQTSFLTHANETPVNQSLRVCQMCNQNNHVLRQCSRFIAKSVSERNRLVRQWRLCSNCLADNHISDNCQSRYTCSKCKQRHHTLLHEGFYSSSAQRAHLPSTEPTNSVQSNVSQRSKIDMVNSPNHGAITRSNILLGTAMVTLIKDGAQYPVRALLDNGSEASFITERLRKTLRLPFRAAQTQISGISAEFQTESKKICTLTLTSHLQPSKIIPLEAIVLPRLTGNLPSANLDAKLFSHLPCFRLADPKFHTSSNVDILIGSDILPLLMLEGIKKNVYGTLMAQNSIFGWVLSGPLPQAKTISCRVTQIPIENRLEQDLKRFWDLEEVPREKPRTRDEKIAEEYFQNTTTRNTEGRYIVHLPFRPEFAANPPLGDSRSTAVACFLSNERRLARQPELKQQYDSVLKEYVTMGHMKRIHRTPNPSYFLPHHAVLKPESTTTKVRVVFNASSPSSSGLSLNDMLLPGPALQADLPGLLSRWRFYQFVFNGDIEKMYRQIRITSAHTPYQRILMRDTSSNRLENYELKTVTFGVNCAPYLAIRTLHHLADQVKSTHPMASDILRNYMYVDDALGGAHSISTALEARKQLSAALHSAGFHLRKWTANHRAILDGLPPEHLLREDFLRFEDSSQAKTLGIYWNASSDVFQFRCPWDIKNDGYTKRQVLSQIAKLFDPVGWLAPYVVVAKIIMQDIWISQISWDDPISDSCKSRWEQFLLSYPKLSAIRIPRWLTYREDSKVQIHGFCDASEKAYAAALYLRIIGEKKSVCHLLVAKSKVAPVKTISLPRLELAGAVLLAELMANFLPQLPLQSADHFLWTDSTIVLSWLNKPSNHWATFVAHRVTKITNLVGNDKWLHVSSEDNPADISTRGLLPDALASNSLWWHGPHWLSDPSDNWPQTCRITTNTELECKKVKAYAASSRETESVVNRFSSYARMLRVVAYMFRFINQCRPLSRQHNISTVQLNHSELKHTSVALIRLAQRQEYASEINALLKKQELPRDSSLRSLTPFVDHDQVLRVLSRLANSSTLTYDESHPIILPNQHRLTRLYLEYVHAISLHGEMQLMMRLARSQFWIPKVKNLIKEIIHKCKACTLYRQKVQQQLMGSLPESRSKLTRPFTICGLDFAGPFDVRSSPHGRKSCYKCYVCVFVCFATKAIHLEATTALSTQAFLATFQRFISRRGCPTDIYSDNGTTFVGADRAIAQEFHQACRFGPPLPGVFQQPQWHFIPPGAPHMGGLWEAAVKSFKIHLKKAASAYKYTYEEFTTLLHRIEACLNSRPLTPMSENASDLCALTPGHFLTGGPLLAPAEDQVYGETASVVNRWQRLKAIHHDFARWWKEDYLSILHKRQKWQTVAPNVKQNDLVVIKEDNLLPHEWRLGRIMNVFPGKDDLVRVVEVRTQKGVVKRPITKIIILPTA